MMCTILPNLNKKNKPNPLIEALIKKLYIQSNLEDNEMLYILDNITQGDLDIMSHYATLMRFKYYDKSIYLRGLVEFSNYCKQGCLYCGISRHNANIDRYRLRMDEILKSVKRGLALGIQTFVLQSGEDPYYTDDKLVEIVKNIKSLNPQCAVTLSVGELSNESYHKLYEAGVERYLLRHEAASPSLYQSLHQGMTLVNRMRCLEEVKAIGYQVGAGFMVGLPHQTNDDLLKDLKFVKNFSPHMCGIGPFICHPNTPLKGNKSGTALQTLVMLGLTRLLLPKVLLPATTALETLDPLGKERAFKFGANVLMPNLTPVIYKNKYELYQNKVLKYNLEEIQNNINKIGYIVDMSRGDHIDFRKEIL